MNEIKLSSIKKNQYEFARRLYDKIYKDTIIEEIYNEFTDLLNEPKNFDWNGFLSLVLDNFESVAYCFDYDTTLVTSLLEQIKDNKDVVLKSLVEKNIDQIPLELYCEFSKKSTTNKHGELNGYLFSCNGVVLCQVKKYSELFCPPGGNIRSVRKLAKSTSWNVNDICKVTGHIVRNDFRGSYPDTNHGYTGDMCTFAGFKERIYELVNGEYLKAR